MGFHFVLPSSRELLDGPRGGRASSWTADEAVRRLRADCMRWSRLGLGVGAFVVAGAAGGLALVIAGSVLTGDPRIGAFEVVMMIVAAVIAVAALVPLEALRRSNRALTRSAKAWQAAPRRTGERPSGAANVFAPRTAYEPAPMVARITATALVWLLAVFGIAAGGLALSTGGAAYAAGPLYVGLLSAVWGVRLWAVVARFSDEPGSGDPLRTPPARPAR